MGIFDGLNKEQEMAVRDTDGVMLILAGAGSGKTRVLTCRVANLVCRGVDPSSILAITFTNKAAKEMKERTLKAAGRNAASVWLMTFHSFCVRFLRQEIVRIPGYTRNFSIYDDSDSTSLMKTILKDFNVNFKPGKVLDWISKNKNELVGTKDFEGVALSFNESKFYEIYVEYQKRLRSFNALDFDDLLLFTAKILMRFPEVRFYWQQRFRYILVDEYQDTNHAQYQIVKLLFTKNLCVVGDVDQCIYGFRGADIRNINNFSKDYPGYKLVKLEQNYRSTGYILEAANAVIEHNEHRPKKVLWTASDKGDRLFRCFLQTSEEEAAFVTKTVNLLRTKYSFSFKDISVLYRTNAQSRAMEESFLKAGIPYVLVGGLRFYDRREIKDVLSYLRFMINPYDVTSMLRAFKNPKRGVGEASLRKLNALASANQISLYDVFCRIDEFKSVRGNVKASIIRFIETVSTLKSSGDSLVDLIRNLVLRTGYIDFLKKEYPTDFDERIENISEFINIARSYIDDDNGPCDLEGFLDRVSLMTDLEQKNVGDSNVVTLMTVHGSKGLEFPVVFMVGMEEGIFPHRRSLLEDVAGNSTAGLEEERRLCYVAMTRAKRLLILTSCKNRMTFGDWEEMEPSRFLSEIPDSCVRP